MKKKDSKSMGMTIPRKIRMGGTTFYLRQGQLVGRPSTMHEKRSCTLPQFKQRQKMRHSIALWKMLRVCEPMFTDLQITCPDFKSRANQLPVVYVDKMLSQASFLMPDLPVSEGVLPTVKQELGEVDGVSALLTDLSVDETYYDERLLLYTAVQRIERELPRVRFNVREISRLDMMVVDGHYVLKGEEFADETKGWALVQIIGNRCSPQGIVTRCTLYQQYTTEEALEVAADSYGGLTDSDF